MKLWTYQDLAGFFKVHESTIRRWFDGKRKFKKAGSVRITQAQLDAFVLEHCKEPKKK